MTAAVHGIAAELALPLSEPEAATLVGYLDLLERWNGTYNLTAVRDPALMLTQHIADCLAIVAPLLRYTGGASMRVLDAGSGGGLPGVLLAVMRPELDVTCVDAVRKKVAFVSQVAAELRLPNLHAVHSRIEALRAARFDIATSRAFSSLADFVRLTGDAMAPQGIWVAMKGKTPHAELGELPEAIDVFHVEQLKVPGLSADRCLVWMRRAA